MSSMQNDFNKLSHSSNTESVVKDLIGGYNLEQLQLLKQTLDEHYKANYSS